MEVGDNILVYGTLKSGHGANSMMQGRSEFVQDDRINAKMYNLGAFPGIKAVAETEDFNSELPKVEGEVYRIAAEDLPRMLDNYEGYPGFYSRRQFVTEKGLKVWAYEKNGNYDDRDFIESGRW